MMISYCRQLIIQILPMKYVQNLILTILLSFVFIHLSAQSVILINGVPTKVQLDGSEIISVQGEVTNHLGGFDSSVPSDNFQYVPFRKEASQPVLAEAKTPLPPRKDKIITKSKANNSPILSGEYLKFGDDSAILSDPSIATIKSLSTNFKAQKAKSILLESFHAANDKKSIELTKNRLEACKNYFEVNGVPSNVIITNMYPNDKESPKVSITIR